MGYVVYGVGQSRKTGYAVVLGKHPPVEIEGVEYRTALELEEDILQSEPNAENPAEYARRMSRLIFDWVSEPIVFVSETHYPYEHAEIVVAGSMYDNDTDVGKSLCSLVHEG
jgi:hypothetical protein